MKVKPYLLLHALLLLYALSTLLSKLAAGEEFLSPRFILFYGGVIGLLGIYALGWQQVIKRLPLTAAYANKAVTVVWGLVAGLLFFGEAMTWGKATGAAMVIAGVVLFALADGEQETPPQNDPADAAGEEASAARKETGGADQA